jgi:hypothetical protein
MLEGSTMLCAKVKLCIAAAMASAMAGTAPVVMKSSATPANETYTAAETQAAPENKSVKSAMSMSVASTPDFNSDWQPLINSDGLTGWKIKDGKWQTADSILIGETPAPSKSWIETADNYEHFELTGQIRVTNGWYAEVRFWSYDYYAVLEMEKSGNSDWQEIRFVVDGREMSATLNGKPLTILHGITPADKSSKISFVADGGKRIELNNLKIRRVQSGPPLEAELSF